ncbi:MAG TPA: flagellar motor protein MotD [Gammaproteobacteria bacterium]
MARRRRHEEAERHESWAIPYGDLVTLLLAFFVVMYSISSINEGKYRILSDSLVAAFRGAPKSLEPIQIGEVSRSNHELQTRPPRTLVPLEIEQHPLDLLEQLPDAERLQAAGFSASELEAAALLIDQLNEEISTALGELVAEDLVRLRKDRFWLEIEINMNLLFPSASAELTGQALPVARRIAEILAGTPVRIHVEGHTDERPISTHVYPSNWELSAARAARVVRLFADAGVEGRRMVAVGFGEFQPVADNSTPEGRQANRRVVIVVMADRARLKAADAMEALVTARLAEPAEPEPVEGPSP